MILYRPLRKTAIALCLTSAPHGAFAQLDLNLALALDESVRHVTNATRLADEDLAIDERQISTLLNVSGELSGAGGLKSSVNYQLLQTEYELDSQSSDPQITGSTSIELGGGVRFYSLSLAHDRRRVVKDLQESVALSSNQDDRDVLSYSVGVGSNPTLPNVLAVTLSGDQTRFDELETNNKNSLGVEFDLSRSISRLTQVGLGLNTQAVEYVEVDSSDYDLHLGYVYWKRHLQNNEYNLSVGVNSIERDSGSDSSPYVDANVVVRSGGASLELGFTSSFQDNVSAQGGSVVVNGDVVESSLTVRDQYQRQSIFAALSNKFGCISCDFSLRTEIFDDEYQIQEDENRTAQRIEGVFGYQFVQAARVKVLVRVSNYLYELNSAEQDFRESALVMDFSKSIGRYLNVYASVKAEERNFENGERDYDTSSFGVGIRYSSR